MGIFSNLFRGEMLEKTLHYYYLTPLRREVLVAGKYLAGLVDRDGALRGQQPAISFLLIGRHFGAAYTDYILHGPGLQPTRLLHAGRGAGLRRLRRGLPDERPVLPQSDDPGRGGDGLGEHQPVPAHRAEEDQRDLLPEESVPGGRSRFRRRST